MQIQSAKFQKSSATLSQCPPETRPEYAFIGRSNVGKSSFINMLTGQKKLAQTSSKPGKTQLINHFLINDLWYLVDLPGYGYAKTSKTNREKFVEMIKTYILHRKNLMTLFILIDSNIPPQANDIEFINRMGDQQIPFVLLFTKCDRISTAKVDRAMAVYKKELTASGWTEMPIMIATSAETGTGRDAVLDYIAQTNELFTVPGT